MEFKLQIGVFSNELLLSITFHQATISLWEARRCEDMTDFYQDPNSGFRSETRGKSCGIEQLRALDIA